MKSYIPPTLSLSRKLKAHGTAAALMKHCLIWQWLHEVLAPGYSLWDQVGKLCKKHNNRVGLWRLAWKWKKSDDCPLSETLKAPHFYRRRNHVIAPSPWDFNIDNKAIRNNRNSPRDPTLPRYTDIPWYTTIYHDIPRYTTIQVASTWHIFHFPWFPWFPGASRCQASVTRSSCRWWWQRSTPRQLSRLTSGSCRTMAATLGPKCCGW